jgi:hypothetical protein
MQDFLTAKKELQGVTPAEEAHQGSTQRLRKTEVETEALLGVTDRWALRGCEGQVLICRPYIVLEI